MLGREFNPNSIRSMVRGAQIYAHAKRGDSSALYLKKVR